MKTTPQIIADLKETMLQQPNRKNTVEIIKSFSDVIELVENAENRSVTDTKDVLNILLELMQREEGQIKILAIQTFTNLSRNEKNRACMVELPDVMSKLLSLLESPNEDNQYKALILLNILKQDIPVHNIEKVLPHVFEFLQSKNDVTQMHAAVFLSALSSQANNPVCESNTPEFKLIISTLIELLTKTYNDRTKAAIAQTLANLAYVAENRATIASVPQSIVVLECLLKQPEQDVQHAGLTALICLASYIPLTKQSLSNLTLHLQRNEDKTQELIANFLNNLSNNRANIATIAKHSKFLLELMVVLEKSINSQTHVFILKAFCNLIDHAQMKEFLNTPKNVQVLKQLSKKNIAIIKADATSILKTLQTDDVKESEIRAPKRTTHQTAAILERPSKKGGINKETVANVNQLGLHPTNERKRKRDAELDYEASRRVREKCAKYNLFQ